MSKILVTGGAGFVGSHLCERLVKDKHEVICIDNFFTGSLQNIKHIPSLHLRNRDVIYPMDDINCDEIYNLACPAAPVHYQSDPIKTIKTSILGAISTLDLAVNRDAKILLSSTSEVYGDPTMHPQREDYRGSVNTIGIRACYDEGKRCAETLFMDYRREFKIPIKIARIFNTYGPRMSVNDGRVVSNFIIQALRGKDIEIYGDGTQTRSFQYVDDLIEALIRLMDTPDDFTGPINLGNPHEIKVLELANIVLEFTKSKSKIVHKPLPQDDPVRRQPDISLAKKTLKWQPKVSLEDGLLRTIEYFKSVL